MNDIISTILGFICLALAILLLCFCLYICICETLSKREHLKNLNNYQKATIIDYTHCFKFYGFKRGKKNGK